MSGVILLFPHRLSPYEWNEPKNEENHFTFLNSLWFGAGALTLQGELGGADCISSTYVHMYCVCPVHIECCTVWLGAEGKDDK